jgi:putative phosphoribosyl transferase
MASLFEDRFHAGRFLATRLPDYAHRDEVTVLALPRGGVPVAFEISRALGLALDVFLVRKLGVPGHEELAMGAIASGGVRVLNQEVIDGIGIPPETIAAASAEEQRELERREQQYRRGRAPLEITGRVIILVDDGLATGASMRAAARAVRHHKPEFLTIAVPVGSREVCAQFESEADEVVCGETPEPFHAVGLWYSNFQQVSDEQVTALLARAPMQKNSMAGANVADL